MVRNARLGRDVRPVPYRPGANVLAPRLTVMNAARGRRLALPLRLRRSDLMGWDKQERRSLTMILLADTSRSVHQYIEVFRQILQSMAGYFSQRRDRIGLITLQGRQARILNHPTHNYRVVTNRLGKLQIHGESPIADGLLKALEVAQLERFRNPSSRSLVVLISDCCPEPLTHRHDDLFDEPAYRDAIRHAGFFKKGRVQLLVINPACTPAHGPRAGRPGPGERLSERLASAAGGRLLKIPYRSSEQRVSAHELDRILEGMESLVTGQLREGRSGLEPWSGASLR